MAEVIDFPGCSRPPAEVLPSDISKYFRELADLIDSGHAPVDAAVIVLAVGKGCHFQVLGADSFHAMGMLGFAQRMVQ